MPPSLKGSWISPKFVCLLIAAFGLPAPSFALLPEAGLFVRPSYWAVHYGGSSFSSNMQFSKPDASWARGGSLAIGVDLGAGKSHELSIELGRLTWDFTQPYFGSGTAASTVLGASGHGHLAPLLVNYRFSILSPWNGLRIYGAISAGTTKVQGDVLEKLSGVMNSWSGDDWKKTYGFGAGVSWDATSHISLEVGYRLLRIGGSNWPSHFGLSSLNFSDIEASAFTAAVSFKL